MAERGICSIDGCGKPARVMGWCSAHYQRLKPGPRCAADGCDRATHSKGYCGKHAYKVRVYGDPHGGRTSASPGEPLSWIERNASHEGEGCLPYPYEVSRYGYGTLRHEGVRRPASRVMCIVAHGQPPRDGMDAAHSCGNRICCNPRHLRWASRGENNLDAVKAGTWMKGERARTAKLTKAEVRKARKMKGRATAKDVGVRFGVTEAAIHHIWSGRHWAWLED